ncbi:MAG: CBS domain containing-hemolysin-like protein [Bacteriovoracaceae bacterium]|jgi:CBS domain containing-hemolysin-like protein
MIFTSYPIVWISIKISKLIKGSKKMEISRDEIPAMAELGLNSGAIHKSEFEHLRSLIDFASVQLFDVLRENDEVKGLQFETHINTALKEIQNNTFSRLLVFGLNRNDIKGYVMRKDILQSYINKEDIKISKITKKILILEKGTNAKNTFNRLLSMKAHIAAIINENGEFLGIVTLEDLIEVLTGTKIYDEFDQQS